MLEITPVVGIFDDDDDDCLRYDKVTISNCI